jgi:hypothetical protein
MDRPVEELLDRLRVGGVRASSTRVSLNAMKRSPSLLVPPTAASQPFTIAIKETPGKCRWCGCTWEHACDGGCSWANRQQTLCSGCVTFDRDMKTAAGRIRIRECLNASGDY